MFKLIGIVFRYEFTRHFWRRAYLLTTFGVAILALVLFFGYRVISETTEDGKTEKQLQDFADYDPVGYVDMAQVFTPPAGPPFEGKVIAYGSEGEARKALEAGEVKLYYVVAADYLETGKVDIVVTTFTIEMNKQTDLFKAFVLTFLLENNPDTARLYVRLQNPTNVTRHQITMQGETATRNEDIDFLMAYVFAIVLLASTITASGYLMQSVVEERETRMIEILISSIRPTPLLVGKILAMGLLGFLQIVVWLAAASAIIVEAAANIVDLAQLEVTPGALLISIVYFSGGYLLLGGGFAAIGALSNNMREGPQLATFLTLPAVAPLWFTPLFVSEPNGTAAVVISLVPITAPLAMVMRASIVEIPAWQVIVSVVLLAITTLGMMWVAGRLFRIGSLLAGTTPRLRDIPRLLFG